jgi:hypothetical protein
MNIWKEQNNEFFALTLVCRVMPKGQGPASIGRARITLQSKSGSVLGLHSCRALSPVPPRQPKGEQRACHWQEEGINQGN